MVYDREEVSLSTIERKRARNMVSFGYQTLRVSDRMLLIYPESEIHDKQVSP